MLLIYFPNHRVCSSMLKLNHFPSPHTLWYHSKAASGTSRRRSYCLSASVFRWSYCIVLHWIFHWKSAHLAPPWNLILTSSTEAAQLALLTLGRPVSSSLTPMVTPMLSLLTDRSNEPLSFLHNVHHVQYKCLTKHIKQTIMLHLRTWFWGTWLSSCRAG